MAVVLVVMGLSSHLNPSPWRDQDTRHRLAVQREPVSGVGAALRANFRIAPLSPELQALLDRLR